MVKNNLPNHNSFTSSTRAGYHSEQRTASFFYSPFRIHRRQEIIMAWSCVHKKRGTNWSLAAATFIQSPRRVSSTIYERVR